MTISIPQTKYTFRIEVTFGRWYANLLLTDRYLPGEMRSVTFGGAVGSMSGFSHYRSAFWPS
jgi:hypothetical protein